MNEQGLDIDPHRNLLSNEGVMSNKRNTYMRNTLSIVKYLNAYIALGVVRMDKFLLEMSLDIYGYSGAFVLAATRI